MEMPINQSSGCGSLSTIQIDRSNSVEFSFHASTKNTELKELIQSIWDNFSYDEQLDIDGTSNNKGVLGIHYLELVVVQMFHQWVIDPTVCIASIRNNNTINVRNFYNTKMIDMRKLVRVWNVLEYNGYITVANHSFDRENPTAQNTTTRVMASAKLQDMFGNVSTTEFDVDLNADSKQLHLTEYEVEAYTGYLHTRNTQRAKIYIKYNEDTPHIAEKLKVLKEYNRLLSQTHVDIANLEEPYVPRKRYNKVTKTYDETKIAINQSKKFVRRVFSRNSWKANGRFYGGFWQLVGSDYRQHIRINGETTVELDYKSLHPNLLLILEGLEPSTDVYGLGDTPIVDRYDLDTQRSIVKLAVLMLLNTDDIEKAYNALIAKFATPPEDPVDIKADLTREEFNSYLDAFIMHHPSLEKYMGKDEGISLMYQDSLIVEELIRNFTAREIPILCVHDSIIIQEKYLDLARVEMKKATVKLLGVELDFDQNRVTKDLVDGTRGFNDTEFTASYWDAFIQQYPSGVTTRYQDNLDKFNEWRR